MFANAIPPHALQARPVDFFKYSALLRRRRHLLFLRLVDAFDAFEREQECGTDILRDVLYRRRTRPVVPRRPFTRTARHRREDENGNAPNGNAAWFRKWNVTSYEEYYALREPSFYVEHPDVDELTRNDFARKFRLPYETFYELYEEMKRDNFMRERSMAVPLKIKLLASLRYLALGVPWDAMEDIVNVSRRTLRTWFHDKFLPWMMEHKYHQHVKYPTTRDELTVLMDPWTRAGFPGCIGCVDGVHIPWGGYRAGRKYMYVGKEGVPTLGFNVTIDYDGRIIFCSDRQRGSANDKTAIKFDEFHRDVLSQQSLYTTQPFLLSSAEDGESEARHEFGVYTLSDGGYLGWRTTMSAFSRPLEGTWEAKWTRYQESLRKKVECAFGILKKRWRCLRVESQCRDELDVERVFKVCCCLHNMIHTAHVERRARQGVAPEPDWRFVDEEELHRIYGDDFNDNARTSPAAARGPGAVPSAEMSTLRRKLVEHFKQHYNVLRARDDVHSIVHAVGDA